VPGHDGPFVPLVLQACQEDQLAYEYRDGLTSYGAFTFALTQVLRDLHGKEINFQELTDEVGGRLRANLKLDQTPCLFGAGAAINRPVPWGENDRPFGQNTIRNAQRQRRKPSR
jgi:hypothetical protein